MTTPPCTERLDVYLVLEAQNPRNPYRKNARVVGMKKNKPALKSGQIAVKVKLQVPGALFDEYIPTIAVDLEPSNIIAPITLTLEDQEDTTA